MFQLNWNTETSLWIWLAFGQNGSIPVELGRRHSIKWNLMGMNGPPGTPGRSSSISEEGASLVASFIQLFIAVHLERCRSDPRLKWPRLHIICMSIGSLFPPPPSIPLWKFRPDLWSFRIYVYIICKAGQESLLCGLSSQMMAGRKTKFVPVALDSFRLEIDSSLINDIVNIHLSQYIYIYIYIFLKYE